jgi:hypothetical protein
MSNQFDKIKDEFEAINYALTSNNRYIKSSCYRYGDRICFFFSDMLEKIVDLVYDACEIEEDLEEEDLYREIASNIYEEGKALIKEILHSDTFYDARVIARERTGNDNEDISRAYSERALEHVEGVCYDALNFDSGKYSEWYTIEDYMDNTILGAFEDLASTALNELNFTWDLEN